MAPYEEGTQGARRPFCPGSVANYSQYNRVLEPKSSMLSTLPLEKDLQAGKDCRWGVTTGVSPSDEARRQSQPDRGR